MVKLEIGNKVALVALIALGAYLLSQYPSLGEGFVEQIGYWGDVALGWVFDGLSWGIQENDLKLMIQLAVMIGIVGLANFLGIRPAEVKHSYG